MNRNRTYKVGDTITYIAIGGERRTGKVVEKYDNIKHGSPGFEMQLPNGDYVWGYNEQIV